MKKNLFTLVLIVVAANLVSLKAQVTIGSNDQPDGNALLDLKNKTDGSADKGLLLPRVALKATNDFSPLTEHVKGMAVYNTAIAGIAPNNVTAGYYYNDGTQWVRLADAATEPWNNVATQAGATSNTQDIYQMGKVGINTSSPNSTLTVNGSYAGKYRTVSVSTAIDATDFYVAYNSATAGIITLPEATAAAPAAGNTLGRIYHIKNTGTAALTVAASGSELIDWTGTAGLSTFTVSPGSYAIIISKGTTSGTTWELVLLYAPTAITTIASVAASDNIYFDGTALTDFNNFIPQIIPFAALDVVINQGGSAVWNDTGNYWDIKESGIYKLEAYANYGSDGAVTPYSNVYYSSTTPSFTATGADKLYGNAFTGINLNFLNDIGDGTGKNIIGGTRANIDNEVAGVGNTQINTSCVVHLNAGNKVYLSMNLGFGSKTVNRVKINTPNNLKQNRYFSLQQLSTP